MKNCKICFKLFTPVHNRSVICGKECKRKLNNLASREWSSRNPEKRTQLYRKMSPEAKQRDKDRRKDKYNKEPFHHKKWHLLGKFNITLEKYNEMLLNQNKKCAICQKEETKTFKGKLCDLAVDHCHVTGKVRGLLCFSCNTSLGKFQDSIVLLQNAINYLEKNK